MMDYQRKTHNKSLVYFCLVISCYLLLLLFSHIRFYLKLQDCRVENIRSEKEERKQMTAKIDKLIQLIEAKDISHINQMGLEMLKKLKKNHEQNNKKYRCP